MARQSVVILPTSASELNRLWAATEVARSDGIEEIISKLWNPHECPLAFLPHLAWAVSVDVWEDEWPEAVKRDVIAASPIVHRLKGTRGSVERALAALGLNTEIQEWWETEPVGRRGTFEVTAFVRSAINVDDLYLGEKIQRQAIAAIKASKPKSRVFSFRIGAEHNSDIKLGAAIAAKAVDRRFIRPQIENRNSTIVFAGAIAAKAIDRRTVRLI